MLKLLRMQVEGFCSISELQISFNQNQTILIRGKNGNGKSVIFSSLIWGLYGKTIKGVSDVQTWKEFRPKDYKGVKVSVYFQRGESIYQVIRCQKYEGILEDGSKGKDRFIVIKDADPLDIKGKIQLQQKLVSILGLTQSLFTNSIMFGQGINRLIQESNTDKKKLFEEVFDLNYLNVAKDIATRDRNRLLSQLRDIERESLSVKRELESALSTYKDLKSRESDFSKHIKEEVSELKADKKKLQAKHEQLLPKLSDGKDLKTQLVKHNKELNLLKTSYQKAKSVSNIPVRDFIKNVYDMLQNKQYKKASNSLLELMEAFKSIDGLLSEIESKSNYIEALIRKYNEFNRTKQILEGIQEDLEDIKKQIKKLKEQKLKVLSPKYKSKIKELKSELSTIEEAYKSKETELEDYTWLIDDPLGNNGIKAYLFDSSLDFLNKELDRYADILGFRISFEIDLSTARKEFVTLIERDGHIIDYEELSGGEKQLVDISMAFAMNQALTVSKGINIAFLDEVFESLSSDNIELVIQLVKEVYKDKTLFLISHHDSLPFSNAKILEVEKQNGLSSYKGL